MSDLKRKNCDFITVSIPINSSIDIELPKAGFENVDEDHLIESAIGVLQDMTDKDIVDEVVPNLFRLFHSKTNCKVSYCYNDDLEGDIKELVIEDLQKQRNPDQLTLDLYPNHKSFPEWVE